MVEKVDDARMVYNGTSSGLNEVLWAPHFMLPTMSTQMREIQLGTNMGDINIGEIFLNFIMHKSLRHFWGVDVKHIQSEDPKLVDWKSQRCSDWECWCRYMMGIRPLH